MTFYILTENVSENTLKRHRFLVLQQSILATRAVISSVNNLIKFGCLSLVSVLVSISTSVGLSIEAKVAKNLRFQSRFWS